MRIRVALPALAVAIACPSWAASLTQTFTLTNVATSYGNNVGYPLALSFNPALGMLTDTFVEFNGTVEGSFQVDPSLPIADGATILGIQPQTVVRSHNATSDFSAGFAGPTVTGTYHTGGTVTVGQTAISDSNDLNFHPDQYTPLPGDPVKFYGRLFPYDHNNDQETVSGVLRVTYTYTPSSATPEPSATATIDARPLRVGGRGGTNANG